MLALLVIALVLVFLFVIGGVWIAKWLFILAVVVALVWLIMYMAGRSRV